MKTKLVLLIITIIMILGACSDNEIIDNDKVQDVNEATENAANDNDTKNTIELTFTPVSKVTLKEGSPKEGWIKGKSIYFGNLSNQIESTAHLYIDNNNNSELKPGDGTIYGFLVHENKFYELGEVGNYNINSVNVNLVDRTFDGIKEIEFVGDMGSTYREMKIIAYNEANNDWENLLTMGSPQIVDLDRDGQDELVAVSVGSLPPFVEIYRWNNDHFEKADITENTKSTYANLYTVDGEWIIETGIYDNGKTSEPKLYKYKEGKLIEYK